MLSPIAQSDVKWSAGRPSRPASAISSLMRTDQKSSRHLAVPVSMASSPLADASAISALDCLAALLSVATTFSRARTAFHSAVPGK